MKYSILIVMVLAVSLAWAGGTSLMQKRGGQSEVLTAQLETSRDGYRLGEAVALSFKITNSGPDKIRFVNSLEAGGGNISIFISPDGKNYYRYVNPKWGLREETIVYELAPGESIETSTAILWNHKPDVKGLNDEIAKRATEGKIFSDYAFSVEGNYFVKFVYDAYFPHQQKTLKFESAPIRINIEKPVGDDLQVWNIIKDRKDFAYFAQVGEFLLTEDSPARREIFQREIEELIRQYPSTRIAEAFRKNLESYKKNQDKAKSYLEKMRSQKEL